MPQGVRLSDSHRAGVWHPEEEEVGLESSSPEWTPGRVARQLRVNRIDRLQSRER